MRGFEEIPNLKQLKRIIILHLFFIAWVSHAQQDPLFTQYIYNKLAFNPGYAGSNGQFSMDIISRFQWTGIEGAPRTISFGAHTPLRNQHIGLGFYTYRDELGPSIDYGAMAAFSYRIIFPTTKLCFGIQAGFKYMDIDWNLLDPKDAGDLLLSNQVKNKIVPDVDFGIYYYGSRFYSGLSAKHLLQNQIIVSSAPPDDKTSFTKLVRNFYGMAGVAVPLSEYLVFMPSTLIKYVKDAPLQADITACFLIKNILTFGASYRTGNALALLAEINIQGLTIGYSYDIWFNTLKAYNAGSHEIRIGYGFDLFNKNRMLTPRYF
jgi:type IX secretion system PorP/SprF family membrane protein